jgi:hypothetical protein
VWINSSQVSPGWSWCALRRTGNNPARGCTFHHSARKNILFSIDVARRILDEMNGLHPNAMLITDSTDEKHAGKSWLVMVRHEVHG